ncbi:MAG: hypothetical protein KDB03_28535, partial [Planctomycetales bacterium]|nr:hypothetical protein [Planctomycetales bacterium]
MNTSTVVFAGKSSVVFLEDREQVSEPKIRVTFETYQHWKGPAKSPQTLVTTYNTYTCEGYSFQDATDYLVFA